MKNAGKTDKKVRLHVERLYPRSLRPRSDVSALTFVELTQQFRCLSPADPHAGDSSTTPAIQNKTNNLTISSRTHSRPRDEERSHSAVQNRPDTCVPTHTQQTQHLRADRAPSPLATHGPNNKVVLGATNTRPTSRLNNEHHGCIPLFKLLTNETMPLLFKTPCTTVAL